MKILTFAACLCLISTFHSYGQEESAAGTAETNITDIELEEDGDTEEAKKENPDIPKNVRDAVLKDYPDAEFLAKTSSENNQPLYIFGNENNIITVEVNPDGSLKTTSMANARIDNFLM